MAQDSANKIVTKQYKSQPADDTIDDILSTASSEITFASLSTAPSIPYLKGIDKYHCTAIGDIIEEINYDAWVKYDKTLQLFAIGSIDSGVTLKAVAGATDNNIIGRIERTEVDALDLWNYIIVRGKKVEDGWTEGNASDWTGMAGNVVSNEYTTSLVKVGVGSIKCAKGTSSEGPELHLAFPKYGFDYLDFTKCGSAEMCLFVMQWITGTATLALAPFIRLRDTDDNEIDWILGTDLHTNHYHRIAVPVGMSATRYPNELAGITGRDRWIRATGTEFNWQVEEISILCPLSSVEILYVDGLSLPVKMLATSQDAGSQGSYRIRYRPLNKPDIESQVELQNFADSMRDKLHEPLAALKLTCLGSAGVVAATWKLHPGYKVTVNAPGEGLSGVVYRIIDEHIVIVESEQSPTGYEFFVELSLLPYDVYLERSHWGSAMKPEITLIRELNDRLSALEDQSEEELDYFPGLPNAVADYKVSVQRGTAFPISPIEMMSFYRTDLGVRFLYMDGYGWVPHGGPNLGTRTTTQTPDLNPTEYNVVCSALKGEFEDCGWQDVGDAFTYPNKENAKHELTKVTVEAKRVETGDVVAQTTDLRCMVSINGADWTQFGASTGGLSTSYALKTFTGDYKTALNQTLYVKLQAHITVQAGVSGAGNVYVYVQNFKTDERASLGADMSIA
jgi:hypothetical protein